MLVPELQSFRVALRMAYRDTRNFMVFWETGSESGRLNF
jgi:hypothetical protein